MTSRHYALISLSVLSLALAFGCPNLALAKEKASATKSESVKKTAARPSDNADSDDSDAKPATKSKISSKTSSKKKTAAASDDDDSGPAKAKTRAGKTTKLADSDDDTPTKKKGAAKTTVSSDDDADTGTAKSKARIAKASRTTKLADNDSDAPAKKKGAAKSTLASDDDTDSEPVKGKAKTSKASKSTRLADSDSDAPTKKKSSAKTVAASDDDTDSDTVKGKASKTIKAARLANADTSDKKNKKSTGKKASADDDSDTQALADNKALKSKTGKVVIKVDQEPVKMATAKPIIPDAPDKAAIIPVVMNAAPVPYKLVATQVPRPTQIALNPILSPEDTAHYQTAYALIDQGDFVGAEAQLALVSNKSLMGYAEFHKLFATGYDSTYDELIDWMNHYGDQPMAMRVWGLAKRKKPEGAPDPAFPLLNGNPDVTAQPLVLTNVSRALQMTATTHLSNSHSGDDDSDDDTGYATMPMIDPNDSDLTPKSARSAYNNGQLDQAVTLGRKIGDHWVAGLACWRLQHYDQALAEFKFVSTDPSRNAWSQSGGAYWAARAALKLGHQDEAQTYLKIAASFPFTFYGLLAEARLGVTPAVVLSKKGLPPTFGNEQRTALAASLDGDFGWTKTNAQAQRLNALVQIGRAADAQYEMQAAVQRTSNGVERDRWLALAAKMQVSVNQLQPTDRLFDPTIYPIPDFAPADGYSIDKALLFAFARKESKFDPKAKSYSGAYGLLQLMPSTAALVEDDPSFNKRPQKLLKPAVNLRVGQKYIQRLFDSKIVSNDLLRTIAAYNAGPRPVKDALDSLGPDADSLLVMESIPVAQTRQYVEEVAANYWIYRQILDNSSKTLLMAANDAAIIDASADQ